MKPIDLYIITGFLGSGKTSVMNNILDQLSDTRVAVVLNDFGRIGVDQALIEHDTPVFTTELRNGQIFCSCLSGSFVQAVINLIQYEPDVVFVETSGLAKPAPMMEIISWIQQKSEQRFSFKGMICVIDALRYLPLSQSLKTIEEQIFFSDFFILNKTDCVDRSTIEAIHTSLSRIQPNVQIHETTFGKVDFSMISSFTCAERLVSTTHKAYQGWGLHGRPKNCTLTCAEVISLSTLEQFLNAVGNHFLRIKGFIQTIEKGLVYAGTVGPMIEIRPISRSIATSEIALVFLYNPAVDAPTLIKTH